MFRKNNASRELKKAAYLAGARGEWKWTATNDGGALVVSKDGTEHKIEAIDLHWVDNLTWEEIKKIS